MHETTASPLAAIYARVSTEEQAEGGYSLPTQLSACAQYATQYGLTVPESYLFQDDITGTTLHRPGLLHLRDVVAQRVLQAVIVYDLDRLARVQALQMVLIDEFAAAGVQVYEHHTSPAKPSPERRLLTQFKGIIAEYELAKIRERTERGRRGKAQAGIPARSHVPLGYRYVGDTKQGHYEIEAPEAQVVQQMYHWCVEEGLTLYRIAQRLTTQQIPTYHARRGLARASHWSTAYVHKILTTPLYCGTQHYGKTTRIPSRTQPHKKSRTQATDPTTWVPIVVPALIDPALFAAAQQRLHLNAQRSPRHQKHPYLLGGGRLRCGHCGRKMGGSRLYYRCNTRSDGIQAACRRSLRAPVVDPLVWDEVGKLVTDPDYLAALLARYPAAQTSETLQQARREVTQELQRVERTLARLTEAYLAEAMPVAEYKTRREGVDGEAALLRTRLEALEAQAHGLDRDAQHRVQLQQAVQGMRTVLAQAETLEAQRRVMDTLGLEVVYEASGELALEITPLRHITSTSARLHGSNLPSASLTLTWTVPA